MHNSEPDFLKIWPVSLTKKSGSVPGASRKILQSGHKVTKRGTVYDRSTVDLRGCQHFWLAGHRVDQSSISPFVWMVPSQQGCDSDVSAIRFSNWAPNQPDNAGDESVVREACLAMANSTSTAWYDVDCAERICAICEYHDRPNDDSGTEFEHH